MGTHNSNRAARRAKDTLDFVEPLLLAGLDTSGEPTAADLQQLPMLLQLEYMTNFYNPERYKLLKAGAPVTEEYLRENSLICRTWTWSSGHHAGYQVLKADSAEVQAEHEKYAGYWVLKEDSQDVFAAAYFLKHHEMTPTQHAWGDCLASMASHAVAGEASSIKTNGASKVVKQPGEKKSSCEL